MFKQAYRRILVILIISTFLITNCQIVLAAESDLTYVVDGTTMTGTLETQITATFPATVPAFFDTAGYVINSR